MKLLPFAAFVILLTFFLFSCSPALSAPDVLTATPLIDLPTQPVENFPMVAPTLAEAAPRNVSMPGAQAVYEKSGNLWAWTGDSAPLQLTSGGADSRPRLSPDGKLVAFQRGTGLWAVEISGQNPRKLFGENSAVPAQFEFAPSSHKVYFTSAGLDGQLRFDLNLADADSGLSQNLLPAGRGGRFTFAPDGKLLALVRPDQIATAQADGSGAQVVFSFQSTQGSNGEYLPQIMWMDNGFGFKTIIPGGAGQPARFMFIMYMGGTPAQLAEFSAAAPTVSESFIAPDGSKAAYLKESGDNLELHVIDASTADKAYFAHKRGQIALLGWTPDSQNLLFWLDDARSTWMMSGNAQNPLSDVSFAADVRWLDANSYIFRNDSELRLRILGQPSQIIDTGITGGFDVEKTSP